MTTSGSDFRGRRTDWHGFTGGSGGLTGEDPATAANKLFSWTERLVGVDGAVIHMTTERGLEVSWAAEMGALDEEIRCIDTAAPGPISRAARHGVTQIVSEESDLGDPTIRTFGWRSAVSVPLIVDEAVIGVFSAGWRPPFPVTNEVRLVLEAAASLSGSVLDRAGLLQDLKQEQQRLREVLEKLPVAASIIEIDNLRVRWRNSQARRLFGEVNENDAAVRMFEDAGGGGGEVDSPTADHLRAILRDETRTGRTTVEAADGRIRVLSPTIARLNQSTSVVIHVDVTREVHIDRERSRFVHMVSHHLRTPLTPLLGYAQLLSGSDLGADTRDEAVAAIVASVDDLTYLVSRLEQIASLQPVEAASMATYAAGELVGEAWKRLDVADGMLRLSGPVETPVECAGEHVVDALVEIFGNSVSHGALPIDVRVTADTEVHLHVSDSGTGIGAEWERAVFAPFLSPGEGYRAPAADHVGLGLSLAHGLVLATGGELTYVDGGFRLSLPSATSKL